MVTLSASTQLPQVRRPPLDPHVATSGNCLWCWRNSYIAVHVLSLYRYYNAAVAKKRPDALNFSAVKMAMTASDLPESLSWL